MPPTQTKDKTDQTQTAAPAENLTPAQEFIAAEIEKAESLIAAKKEVQERIGKMRDHMDNLKDQATDTQRAWIKENLPKRVREPKASDTPAEKS